MSKQEIARRNFLKTISAGVALGNAIASPAVKRVGTTAERLKEKPYEKRLCRVESYPSCLSWEAPRVGVSIEEYVNMIHGAGMEVQIVGGEIDRGTPRFRSKMIPPLENVDLDPLPQFLELAHQKGILVLTYYPMIYTKPLKNIHPEWLMRFLDDGRPQIENLGWFCLNSPYRDWLPQYLNEFLDSLDLDGIYFDDTNWGSHEEWPFYPSCCCSYCEKLFKDETGLKIPTEVDFSSIEFRKFVNWRYDKMRDCFVHIARKVKEKHPDAVLDYNYYGRHKADWSLGHPLNPLHLGNVGAYFFLEANAVQDGSSFAAKVARAHGSPFAIWRHTMAVLPESVTSSAPYAETFSPTIHGLAALANGGASYYGMFDGPQLLNSDLMKSIFTEVRRRADYIDGETVKYVALHYSQQTRDFHASSISQSCLRTVKGTYEMLNQSHLLVDIIFDEQLTLPKLSQYKVLYLSNSVCLSETQCDQVREFVREGGTLIATHETSLSDEVGQKRDNFALADVVGVDYRGPIKAKRIHGVVYVPHDSVLSREFGYVISFAAEESNVALRSDSSVEVLCTRSSLKGTQPLNNFDLRQNYDSSEPTVTSCRFGKGTAFYISADVGGGYIHNPYPPLKRFVASLVRRNRPPIDVQAPKAIEVTAAMKGPRQLMVHLLNNPTPLMPFSTSDDDLKTYFYLEEVNPIQNIRIKFNDFTVKSATMPLQSLSLVVAGREVIVPEVKLHEVVILELGA